MIFVWKFARLHERVNLAKIEKKTCLGVTAAAMWHTRSISRYKNIPVYRERILYKYCLKIYIRGVLVILLLILYQSFIGFKNSYLSVVGRRNRESGSGSSSFDFARDRTFYGAPPPRRRKTNPTEKRQNPHPTTHKTSYHESSGKI